MLCFVHIPKTGGTSFRNALSFGRTRVASHADSLQSIGALAQKEKLDVLIGHIPYGVHEYIDTPCEYVTVLRHPVERAMSKYHMPAARRPEPPKEWIGTNSRFHNTMVKQLSGKGIAYDGEVDDELYSVALDNLRAIKYVGTTRNLGSLWRRIKKDYGLNRILGHHMASPNPRKKPGSMYNRIENIDSETQDAILAYNKYDLMLFEEALKLEILD
jgi:hypothetical protein